ncbi:hypothetical protein LTR53_006193 [Teratosphaeriaceae sp. CCFEE 6253]|nr:hypothetical protein LTR53_006193 [Teratosphaeriaceae sp. CCFEE 6253]
MPKGQALQMLVVQEIDRAIEVFEPYVALDGDSPSGRIELLGSTAAAVVQYVDRVSEELRQSAVKLEEVQAGQTSGIKALEQKVADADEEVKRLAVWWEGEGKPALAESQDGASAAQEGGDRARASLVALQGQRASLVDDPKAERAKLQEELTQLQKNSKTLVRSLQAQLDGVKRTQEVKRKREEETTSPAASKRSRVTGGT